MDCQELNSAPCYQGFSSLSRKTEDIYIHTTTRESPSSVVPYPCFLVVEENEFGGCVDHIVHSRHGTAFGPRVTVKRLSVEDK